MSCSLSETKLQDNYFEQARLAPGGGNKTKPNN